MRDTTRHQHSPECKDCNKQFSWTRFSPHTPMTCDQFSDISTTAVQLHNISRFSTQVAPWHQAVDWWVEVAEVTYISCVPDTIKIIMLLCNVRAPVAGTMSPLSCYGPQKDHVIRLQEIQKYRHLLTYNNACSTAQHHCKAH